MGCITLQDLMLAMLAYIVSNTLLQDPAGIGM